MHVKKKCLGPLKSRLAYKMFVNIVMNTGCFAMYLTHCSHAFSKSFRMKNGIFTIGLFRFVS